MISKSTTIIIHHHHHHHQSESSYPHWLFGWFLVLTRDRIPLKSEAALFGDLVGRVVLERVRRLKRCRQKVFLSEKSAGWTNDSSVLTFQFTLVTLFIELWIDWMAGLFHEWVWGKFKLVKNLPWSSLFESPPTVKRNCCVSWTAAGNVLLQLRMNAFPAGRRSP